MNLTQEELSIKIKKKENLAPFFEPKRVYRNLKLRYGVFEGAQVGEVVFEDCDFRHARWRKCSGPRVKFLNCDLRFAKFIGGEWPGVICDKRTNIEGMEIAGGNWRNADIRGCGCCNLTLTLGDNIQGLKISRKQLNDFVALVEVVD